MSQLQAGGASRIINCEIGADLLGQLHRRTANYIRDDLEANALYLSDGELRILLINLDICGLLETSWIRQVCAAIAAATGVPERQVITCSTHTHTAPNPAQLLHDSPRNDRWVEAVERELVAVAQAAIAAAQPARALWASGQAHIGYNRRLCWADGSHTMYGDATRPDFAGLEGPDDPQHNILALLAEDGTTIALAHNNCCHSTCVEGANFASADFAGEARRLLRDALRPDLPVLYLQGASADTSPWRMVPRAQRYNGELRLREIGATLAAETLRLLHVAEPVANPPLRHAWRDIEIPVRLLSPDQLAHAERIRDLGVEQAGRGAYVLQVDGALRLHKEFRDNPVDTLAVHALRVGDFVVITNPCELYCQFGLDIKRRSPAAVTAVTQLADGFSGYCPTYDAWNGGGYSAESTWWTRLEPTAGYTLVEQSGQLLHAVFAS